MTWRNSHASVANCAPQPFHSQVYSPTRFSKLSFVSTLAQGSSIAVSERSSNRSLMGSGSRIRCCRKAAPRGTATWRNLVIGATRRRGGRRPTGSGSKSVSSRKGSVCQLSTACRQLTVDTTSDELLPSRFGDRNNDFGAVDWSHSLGIAGRGRRNRGAHR